VLHEAPASASSISTWDKPKFGLSHQLIVEVWYWPLFEIQGSRLGEMPPMMA